VQFFSRLRVPSHRRRFLFFETVRLDDSIRVRLAASRRERKYSVKRRETDFSFETTGDLKGGGGGGGGGGG